MSLMTATTDGSVVWMINFTDFSVAQGPVLKYLISFSCSFPRINNELNNCPRDLLIAGGMILLKNFQAFFVNKLVIQYCWVLFVPRRIHSSLTEIASSSSENQFQSVFIHNFLLLFFNYCSLQLCRNCEPVCMHATTTNSLDGRVERSVLKGISAEKQFAELQSVLDSSQF